MSDSNQRKPLEIFWEKAKAFFVSSGKGFRKVSTLGRIKLDLVGLQRMRDRQMLDLAAKVLDLVGRESFNHPKLAEVISKIRQTETQIAKEEERLQKVRETPHTN